MTQKRLVIALSLGLCLVTGALYFRAVFLPFCIIDDKQYVSENAYVLKGLTLASLKWAFVSIHAQNWHPLTWISLMTDCQLFGSGPMAFHTVNVALHMVNGLLLFLLLNAMTGRVWRCAFVAALFAVHPLHVESVAWIAERKDVLSTFFWMLALLCYTRYVRQRSRNAYLATLAMFVLGLLAKPMVVTLPVVLLLLDYWPLQRFSFSPTVNSGVPAGEEGRFTDALRLLREKIPFFLLSAASSIVTCYAQGAGDDNAIISLEHLTLPQRFGNALHSYLLYVKKICVPDDLAIFYQFAPLPTWQALCALVVIALFLVAVFRKRSEYPYLLTGTAWYLVTLLPVIGVVQVGVQAMADRYTYIPSIGLFLLAAWGGADLVASFPRLRGASLALAGAALAAYAVTTYHQLSYWKDNVTLFSRALAVTRVESSIAHARMGLAYFEEGRPDLAVPEYEEGLRIEPDAESIHLRLAIALDRIGRSAESIEHFRAELKVRPRLAVGHFDLGSALLKAGRLPEAIDEFTTALAIEPDNALCHERLGVVLLQEGRYEEAARHFSETVRLEPNNPLAAQYLQFALGQRH